jgi:2,3-bisphosphoglycerate-dependent phosphoglycerate mutase
VVNRSFIAPVYDKRDAHVQVHEKTRECQHPPLTLLRHGESAANAAGLFTGRWDVPLSERGRRQARRAAELLLESGAVPDLVITSPLLRATQTVEIVVTAFAGGDMDQIVSSELTERAYGALTGLPKAAVGVIFGAEQSRLWRRSMKGRPPNLGDLSRRTNTEANPAMVDLDELRASLPERAREAAQTTESLSDVVDRVRSWLANVLAPQLRSGKVVLVVAHGNSLRALVSVLDALDDSATEALNIPTGEPLLYSVNQQGIPVPGSGRYLDPVSAAAAALAVAAEGGT